MVSLMTPGVYDAFSHPSTLTGQSSESSFIPVMRVPTSMIFPSSFALAHGAEHFTWLEQCGWLLFRKNKCPDVDEIIDAKDVYVCV